jgi:CRISPR-associated protein Cmr1
MESITFTCETITPMFLAGADGQTPELRAPSIKGALRFWWRAMNGDLGLGELKEREDEIFGGTGNRSSFTIQIFQSDFSTSISELVPHKPFMKQQAFQVGETIEIKFTSIKPKFFDIEKIKSLFQLVVCLGGFGKRSRRGMGSLKILNQKMPDSLEEILDCIQHHSKHYHISGDSIRNTYQGRMQYYGWIKQIQIGRTENQQITRVVSQVTHDVKKKYGMSYEPNLGHAFKGRFASPVYVSVLGNDETPVITTLNAVPDRGNRDIDLFIQEDFKNQVL